jgi:hypothetical protein
MVGTLLLHACLHLIISKVVEAACRPTNSVTRGPDVDALRVSLIRPEANIVQQLAGILENPGAHALMNSSMWAMQSKAATFVQ